MIKYYYSNSILLTEMPYFKSKSGKVYYEIEGKSHENKDTIIFVHGRTLDIRMWNPQIDYFKSKYQCIAYDLNGFGKSEIPKNDYNRSQTLKDLFIHLKINKAHIVALSLGVDVVIDFALENPNLIQSMVLISGGVSGWDFSEEFMNDWNSIVTEAEKGNLLRAKDLWINCKAFQSLKTTNPQNYEMLKNIIDDYTGWDLVNPPNHKRNIEKAIDRLTEIDINSLIITGKKDYKDFVLNGRILRERLKNAKLVEFEDSAHMVNLEFPERVNGLIEGVLNQD